MTNGAFSLSCPRAAVGGIERPGADEGRILGAGGAGERDSGEQQSSGASGE